MESSSGGAFSAISELWIKNGGVVWGVSIDEDAKASFICVDRIDNLYKIRGSKYVEVNQPMPFEFIKKQLNDGKRCLYQVFLVKYKLYPVIWDENMKNCF